MEMKNSSSKDQCFDPKMRSLFYAVGGIKMPRAGGAMVKTINKIRNKTHKTIATFTLMVLQR